MPKIIKNQQIVNDNWLLLEKAVSPEDAVNNPTAAIIVPLSLWQSHAQQLQARNGQVGIWLDSDDHPEQISNDLEHFPIIAINFPTFNDGRGYSYARLLRERYSYKGELRAIGDILKDQLFYLHRCGFDSFSIRENRSLEDALTSLQDFTYSYQNAIQQSVPLFRKR